MKILIEASGSLVIGGLINSLKSAGLIIYSTDITHLNIGGLLSDYYFKIPKAEDSKLWVDLTRIIRENNIDFVLPSFDGTLEEWSEKKECFRKENTEVIISPKETIKLFTDKWLTYNAFREAGLPSPKTSRKKKYSLVKPRKGRGSKGIKITDNDLVNMDGYVSQEILEGQELTVDCLFDKEGIPIYIIPRMRLKIIDGKSVDGKIVKNELVVSLIKKLAEKYHFIGPINIQCFINSDGVSFIEVNPRIGGGMALSWAASENWFDLWFKKITLGKSVVPKKIKYGLSMYRYYAEVFF
tara:strand:+ start:274 stop:1164 length:891 start_codon:yes stop_codon:yes gene_type:complete